MQFFSQFELPAATSISHKRSGKSFSVAFQDKFDVVYTDKKYEELSDGECVSKSGNVLVFDTEVYQNFFCAIFRLAGTKQVISFEAGRDYTFDVHKLRWIMEHYTIVGFNSREYDIPILQLALTGAETKALYTLSYRIIVEGMRPWNVERAYKLGRPTFDHIDLIEVAPLGGSLKLYAGRLHTDRMQELPVVPTKALTDDEIVQVFNYCNNDLDSTELLLNELKPAIDLRIKMSKEYGIDVRSKSDAQIAEYVLASEIQKRTRVKPEVPSIAPGMFYYYDVPSYLSYHNPKLQQMLEIVRKAKFVVGSGGYINMPEEIGALKLDVGNCVYRMGIGGLHSSEKCMAYTASEDTILIDRDVASYYPAIILNQRLYPTHLGSTFLTVYKKIVDDRLHAKATGDKATAASLKITINGSFGKLGSSYSVLYAPDLMIQITVTGQLSLLMLIDMIEHAGIPVLSGNTDGVVIACPRERYNDYLAIVAEWERLTSFTTEETEYRGLYARDVNNYIAVKMDGSAKVKGCYAERGSAGDSVLSKNPENLICNDALIAHITKGTPVEYTVRNCTDIRRFVTVRNVTGGAVKSGIVLGKCIRWYYSTQMYGEINRLKNGDKVPNSDRARPLMQLPTTLPDDIDYQRYIDIANDMLVAVGFSKRAATSGFQFNLDLEE